MFQLAAKGKIGYLPDVMGVYRKHSAGLSNVHSQTNQKFLQNRKEMFENVGKWLNNHHDVTVSETVKKYTALLAGFEKIGSSN
jgi:hypothetical protein